MSTPEDLLQQTETQLTQIAEGMEGATDVGRRQFVFMSLVAAAASTFGVDALRAQASGAAPPQQPAPPPDACARSASTPNVLAAAATSDMNTNWRRPTSVAPSIPSAIFASWVSVSCKTSSAVDMSISHCDEVADRAGGRQFSARRIWWPTRAVIFVRRYFNCKNIGETNIVLVSLLTRRLDINSK